MSEIKGRRRRVPYLVVTQGIPFLRYGKPQPVSLGRYLRQRVQWEQKQWTEKSSLEKSIALAEWEDRWDYIVEKEHGILDGQHGTPQLDGCVRATNVSSDGKSWTQVLRVTGEEICGKIKASNEKNAEMGKRMWEVVVKEKELAKQEKIQQRSERRSLQIAPQLESRNVVH